MKTEAWWRIMRGKAHNTQVVLAVNMLYEGSQKLCGGSCTDRASKINRRWQTRENILEDYFIHGCVYPADKFRARYRMQPHLFTCSPVQNACVWMQITRTSKSTVLECLSISTKKIIRIRDCLVLINIFIMNRSIIGHIWMSKQSLIQIFFYE